MTDTECARRGGTGTTLAELAGRTETEVALVDDHRSLTWDEFDEATRRIGNGLRALGLDDADHVALVCSNRVHFVTALIAAQRAGLTVSPLKTGWTVNEIDYVLGDAGTRVVLADVPAAKQAADRRGIPTIDLDDPFDDWLAAQDAAPLAPGQRGYRIPYTSGTTGRPKGVVRQGDACAPFEQWWRSQAALAGVVNVPHDGTHLMVSQLFHGAPLAFGLGGLAGGASMRIMHRWSAAAALDLLESANACVMVPTMFRQLLALPSDQRSAFDPSRLASIVHGGEACPDDVKRRMIEWWGPVFTEYYGFTEGGMAVATTEEWLAKPGTVGRPIGGMEVLVVDGDDRPVGPNHDGTIYFRSAAGASSFAYLNAEDKTAGAYRADGSFTVGDIGHLDDEGYLFVSGRSAELIVSAGVNVYPAEIESVIFTVAGVGDCAVAGEPDAERGEHPVALVVNDGTVDDDALVERVAETCEGELARYKRPHRIVAVDEVPRDATGKVLRTVIRDELIRQHAG